MGIFDSKTVQFENIYINCDENTKNYKIVHLSDVHFPTISVDIDQLVVDIKSQNPNLICISGDMVNRNSKTTEWGFNRLIAPLSEKFPVIYANGNHEKSHFDTDSIYKELKKAGAHVLLNDSIIINFSDKQIAVFGLDESVSYSDSISSNLDLKDCCYMILLSHKPTKKNVTAFLTVADHNAPNLVLSGHVHGGVFRPFGIPIFSPDTIFFPRYSNGLYTFKNRKKTHLVVSRGLGISRKIPFRLNNRPHVPIINLRID